MKIKALMMILSVAALSVAAVSCNKELTESEKTERATVQSSATTGIFVDGTARYSTSNSGGEVYVMPAALTCRLQNAGATQYVDVILSQAPVVGGTVNVTLKETGISELSSYNGKTFKNVSVLNLDGDKLYLWHRGSHLGFALLWY